jgi:uncharacterized RDD family membrane protein YckC
MATTTTDRTTTALGVCTSCGAEMPADAAFCPACGARVAPAPPEAAAALAAAAVLPAPVVLPAPAVPVPAGLLARGAAFFIDYMLLVSVLTMGLNFVSTFAGVGGVVLAALGLLAAGQLYWAGLESSRWQASVGKQALRLVVVGIDGTRLTMNRALVRSALSVVPLVAAYAGIAAGSDVIGGFLILFVVPAAVLMAPFNARRQALHDLLTDTMVARRPDA